MILRIWNVRNSQWTTSYSTICSQKISSIIGNFVDSDSIINWNKILFYFVSGSSSTRKPGESLRCWRVQDLNRKVSWHLRPRIVDWARSTQTPTMKEPPVSDNANGTETRNGKSKVDFDNFSNRTCNHKLGKIFKANFYVRYATWSKIRCNVENQ